MANTVAPYNRRCSEDTGHAGILFTGQHILSSWDIDNSFGLFPFNYIQDTLTLKSLSSRTKLCINIDPELCDSKGKIK